MIVLFKEWVCEVIYYQYANGRDAIRLLDAGDGEPVATATVNLPEEECPEGFTFIKDYSENSGILDCLVEAGIVEDMGVAVKCGHAEANLVRILIKE